MQKSKKNAVGRVAVWLLLGGANNSVSKDLSARIAVFFLLATIRGSNYKIALYGLKNGYWSVKLLKRLVGIAACP